MKQVLSMDALPYFFQLAGGRSEILRKGFTSLVFPPFAEQPRFVGDARLGASRWFAGAVIHSLGARVALPRAEVPNVSSSEGYPSSCPIPYAQNNAVIARVK